VLSPANNQMQRIAIPFFYTFAIWFMKKITRPWQFITANNQMQWNCIYDMDDNVKDIIYKQFKISSPLAGVITCQQPTAKNCNNIFL
jgi:hypothetical protein